MSKILILISILFLSISSVYAQTAAEYLKRADLDNHRGNFTQAISDYTKAIAIEPNYEEAYFGRGLVFLFRLKNFSQAISDLTKVIEINPKYIFAYYSRGVAYARQGKFTQAISDYTKVIEMSPVFAPGYIDRGDAYAKQGNFTQAKSDYNQAISEITKESEGAFKTNPKAREYLYFWRGSVYFKEKEYDKAWADVHQAETLGLKPVKKEDLEFLAELKKASGRDQ